MKPGQLSGYDKVIVAIGADPIIIPIPGHDRANVMTGIDALNAPERVKGQVVVIGGGEIGVEVGMFLAKQGHPPTVLEMGQSWPLTPPPIHYYNMVEEAWLHCEGFSSILKPRSPASPTPASPIWTKTALSTPWRRTPSSWRWAPAPSGMRPMPSLPPGAETTVIGDAEAIKTVQGAMRSGYAAGNNA